MYKRNLSKNLLKIEDKYVITDGYQVFEVNEVGARIFDLCNGKNSTEQISEKLSKFYSIPYEHILEDVKEYEILLLNKQIIFG